MAWSEDRLHRFLQRLGEGVPSRVRAGSRMHDAAVLRRPRGRLAACVDATVAGVHFEPDTPPGRIAGKALGRVLSDLAATAARPSSVLASVQAPRSVDQGFLERLLKALWSTAAVHGAELVGGDLTAVDGPLALAVTALGEVPGGRRPPGRDRARPGQVVLVTGPLGGSRLGRHLRVRPRLAEGAWLFARGATALMDVSDGLALDLGRLARASGVRIDVEHVPVHRDARRAARASGRTPLAHALTDGEDHELLATVPARRVARLLAEARYRCPGLDVLGHVSRGRGLTLLEDGKRRPLAPEGWLHG